MTYEDLVNNHAGKMVEKLVTDVMEENALEIRFESVGDEQWSIISMNIYEEDKNMAIRLYANDRFDLYFSYYDDEDEFFELIHLLTPEEKNIIPKGLQKAMLKVLKDQQGIRLPGNFLSKK